MKANEKATYPGYSSVPAQELVTRLQSSVNGLTAGVANKRMKEQFKFYKSESRFKKEIKLLARQFINPLILLLVVAVMMFGLSFSYLLPPVSSAFGRNQVPEEPWKN